MTVLWEKRIYLGNLRQEQIYHQKQHKKAWGIQTVLTAMVSGTKPKPQKETNRLSGLVSYTEWKVQRHFGIPGLWMSCCRGMTWFRIQISVLFCVYEIQTSSVIALFSYSWLDRTYLLNSAYSKGKQSLIFVRLLVLLM